MERQGKIKSISSKLILRVLGVSIALALITSAYQLYESYSDGLNEIDNRLAIINGSYGQSLAYGVWTVNTKQVETMLNGILKVQDISSVEIIEGTRVAFSADNKLPGEKREIWFDLVYREDEGQSSSYNAQLKITVSLERLSQELLGRIVMVLIAEILKVGLLSLFIMLIVNSMITKNIVTMKKFFDHYNPMERGKSKLRLARTQVGVMDEIDVLEASINRVSEDLSSLYEDLDLKVRDRTVELASRNRIIDSMLQALRLGVFTFDQDFRVNGEYSQHLEEIFNTKELPGRDAIELIFNGALIGANNKDQAVGAIETILGYDSLAFDLNSHLLVAELKHDCHGSPKLLDFEWEPIYSEDGIVEKIMVVVRDVTELARLRVEAKAQHTELSMIGEILNVGLENLRHFYNVTNGQLDSTRKLLMSDLSSEAVDSMYRNIHTIKGHARMYKLSYAVDTIHLVEGRYAALKEKEPGLRSSKDDLIGGLDAIAERIEAYWSLLNNRLASLPMAGNSREQTSLTKVRNKILGPLPASDSEKARLLDEIIAILDESEFLTLASVLHTEIHAMPDLGTTLHKLPPHVHIMDDGSVFFPSAHQLLRDVFVHCLTNALDHGIEAPEERSKRGKLAEGQIHILVGHNESGFTLTLSDDGRGLNLTRLREIAAGSGEVYPERLSDEEVAEFVFRSGISTATRVSEVSGRGAGMAAVRSFLETKGGRIVVEFTDEATPDGYRPFSFKIALPASFGRAPVQAAAA